MTVIRVTDEKGDPFEAVAKDGEMDSLDEFVANDASIHIERMKWRPRLDRHRDRRAAMARQPRGHGGESHRRGLRRGR